MVRLVIPGRPVPAVRMTQRSKWTKRAQEYLAYKGQVGWAAKAVFKEPIKGNVRVTYRFYLAGKRRKDWDNLAKGVQDGCNGIAWVDDSQITEAHVYKISDRNERCEIEIEEVGE